jgi:hypothetical protein
MRPQRREERKEDAKKTISGTGVDDFALATAIFLCAFAVVFRFLSTEQRDE